MKSKPYYINFVFAKMLIQAFDAVIFPVGNLQQIFAWAFTLSERSIVFRYKKGKRQKDWNKNWYQEEWGKVAGSERLAMFRYKIHIIYKEM